MLSLPWSGGGWRRRIRGADGGLGGRLRPLPLQDGHVGALAWRGVERGRSVRRDAGIVPGGGAYAAAATVHRPHRLQAVAVAVLAPGEKQEKFEKIF